MKLKYRVVSMLKHKRYPLRNIYIQPLISKMTSKSSSYKVFIATSLDGYIADINGGIGFLDIFPAPEGDDMGYYDFIDGVDAILMGRKSFETVLGFGIAWPYSKHVFVWSNNMTEIPEDLNSKVTLVNGDIKNVIDHIHQVGFNNLYIDGGKTIQSFIEENLISEMTITTVPVLLGEGISLFGKSNGLKKFKCVGNKLYSNGMVQNKFIRI